MRSLGKAPGPEDAERGFRRVGSPHPVTHFPRHFPVCQRPSRGAAVELQGLWDYPGICPAWSRERDVWDYTDPELSSRHPQKTGREGGSKSPELGAGSSLGVWRALHPRWKLLRGGSVGSLHPRGERRCPDRGSGVPSQGCVLPKGGTQRGDQDADPRTNPVGKSPPTARKLGAKNPPAFVGLRGSEEPFPAVRSELRDSLRPHKQSRIPKGSGMSPEVLLTQSSSSSISTGSSIPSMAGSPWGASHGWWQLQESQQSR